jgi:(2Fe-2S) ferredoxin
MTQHIGSVKELTDLRDAVRREQAQQAAAGHKQIRLCMGAGCIASGAAAVKSALEKELEQRGITEKATIVGTGCLGPCSGGPTMIIDDIFYEKVKPLDAADLVGEHLVKGRVVDRLTYKRPDGRAVPRVADVDFFRRQNKIVLRNCGVINPCRIEDYIARDG